MEKFTLKNGWHEHIICDCYSMAEFFALVEDLEQKGFSKALTRKDEMASYHKADHFSHLYITYSVNVRV